MITEGVLFSGYAYGGLSVPVYGTTLSDGKAVRFSSLAATHVMLGNKSTDLPTADFDLDGVEIDLVWELSNPVAHCDDEKIEACSERIRSLRDDVVTRLKQHIATDSKLDLGHARGALGKALHTLQDFYAHSNHADVNVGTQTFDALTGNAAATAGAYARGAGVTVCLARAPTLAWVVAPTYSNNGGNWQLTGDGLIGSKYTTGWFTLASAAGNEAATDTGGVKCDHGNEGGIAATGFSVVSGISKDVPYAPLDDLPLSDKKARGVPSTIHVRASHQAALHTRAFVDSVINAIKASDGNADNQDKMIKALLGIDSDTAVFGFVIDRTGSMGTVIDGVKTQIQKLIDDAVAAGGDAATRKFMIVDYGDPDVSTPVIGNATVVKNYVSGLSARGGGDCPESTNSGLLAALSQAPKGSSLYVFTDASSNDAGKAAEVLALAQSKKITISYALSGSCSPIDPSYVMVANGTGGQVIEVEHTAAAVAAAFTSISIDSGSTTAQPVILEAGSIGAPKTISIPVENGATRLSVTANSDSGSIVFTSPEGVVVAGPNVVLNDFLGGRGMKVTNPAAGIWSVTITPTASGAYDVKADIAGALDVNAIVFTGITPSGRTGHEGPVEFASGPPLGKSRAEVVLNGEVATGTALVLKAITPTGNVLSSVALGRASSNVYVAEVELGAELFRVQVSGKTAAGADFVRILPRLYSPRPLTMEIVDVSKWATGLVGELRVKLTNHGADGTFNVTATAPTAGTVGAITPNSVTIMRGASAVVSVKLAVAQSASLTARHRLEVVASDGASTTERYGHNFALSADTDGDGVPDYLERGEAGTDPSFDGNGDGVPDWQQASVVSLYSRLQRGYVTLALQAPARFASTSSISAPEGAPASLPLDIFDFRILGVAVGGTADVRFYLPTGVSAAGYAKYGPTSSNAAPHWYDFASDGSTGATVVGNVISLRFVDGGRGDDDLQADGVIIDAGGPTGVAVVGIAAPKDPDPTPTPTPTPTPAAADSGGSGGCTIGDPRHSDATLGILSALALLMVICRRFARPWRRDH